MSRLYDYEHDLVEQALAESERRVLDVIASSPYQGADLALAYRCGVLGQMVRDLARIITRLTAAGDAAGD